MKALLLSTFFVATATLTQAQQAMDWTSTSGGTLAGHTVTLTGPLTAPYLDDFNLSTAPYAAAPLANSQECVNYLCRETWTADFSPAIEGLLWYGVFIRGADSNPGGTSVDYTFDRPFVILSGFSDGTVTGNTLTLPNEQFHFGILHFPGVHTSLACVDVPPTGGFQAMTFAQADPGEATFCDPADSNSTGSATRIAGSMTASGGSGLHLEATQGPPNQFGYFLVGTGVADPGLPIGSGHLCLAITGGNGFARYNVSGGALNSVGRFDAAGVLQNLVGTSSTGSGYDVPTLIPSQLGMITAGSTWHFQLWHRDSPSTSNFSNGISVSF